jgi:hypothetical protein
MIFLLISISSGITLGQIVTSDTFKITKITKQIGDIKVNISQYKPLIVSPPYGPYCKAYIEIIKNDKIIDSLGFPDIEPVGGQYGLLVYSELVNDHLIISKYGSYYGLTIIINETGQMFTTIGGYGFIDTLSGLLFSSFASDLPGLSVFNLQSDTELLRLDDIKERPVIFYKGLNDRYFFRAINDYTRKESIWEIMLDKKKIEKADINIKTLQDQQLKQLIDYEKTWVDCE